MGGADAAGFEFTVKLYQKFTHPSMFREAAPRHAPEADAAWLDGVAALHQADIDEFRRGVAPLADAGKLGALLLQFPPSFTATPAANSRRSPRPRRPPGGGWTGPT